MCGPAIKVCCALVVAAAGCGSGAVSGRTSRAGCAVETDAAFCSRLGKSCDAVSGSDNCGTARTVASCGSCAAPQTCAGKGTANVCETASYPVTVKLSGSGEGKVVSSAAGIECGSACLGSFDAGGTVTLTATPMPYSAFTGFSGDCTGVMCTLDMAGPKTVTATFAPMRTLTLQGSATGTGKVTSKEGSPPIDCDYLGSGVWRGTCSATLPSGSVVHLALTGAEVSGFSDPCANNFSCAVTLDRDVVVSAYFNSPPERLFAIALLTRGPGLVSMQPAPVMDHDDVNDGYYWAYFRAGATVTLTANPGHEVFFAGYSGSCTGETCVLTMDGHKGVVASFDEEYPIVASVRGLSGGTLLLQTSIDGGSPQPLSVRRSGDFTFPDPVIEGHRFLVTIAAEPAGPAQHCSLGPGNSGTAGTGGMNIILIQVTCDPFQVATGLDAPGSLARNGASLYFGRGPPPGATDCGVSGSALMRVPTDGSATPVELDRLADCGPIASIAFDSTFVYWMAASNALTRKRALVGGPVSTLYQGGELGQSLVVDPAGSGAYWYAPAAGVIRRIPLPDGGASPAFTSALGPDHRVGLAISGSSLFWTAYNSNTDQEGTVNQVSLAAPPLTMPSQFTFANRPSMPVATGSTIDFLDGYLARNTGTTFNRIYSALVNAGTVTWLAPELSDVVALAADADNAYVLLSNFANPGAIGAVFRVPRKNGQLALLASFPGLPTSIALDEDHVYWTVDSTQLFSQHNSDGSIQMVLK